MITGLLASACKIKTNVPHDVGYLKIKIKYNSMKTQIIDAVNTVLAAKANYEGKTTPLKWKNTLTDIESNNISNIILKFYNEFWAREYKMAYEKLVIPSAIYVDLFTEINMVLNIPETTLVDTDKVHIVYNISRNILADKNEYISGKSEYKRYEWKTV